MHREKGQIRGIRPLKDVCFAEGVTAMTAIGPMRRIDTSRALQHHG